MKWMLDLNVLLDVLHEREPFYRASAKVLSLIVEGEATGCLPSHALTTAHYIVRRNSGVRQADNAIDWLLSNLEIVSQDESSFRHARSLSFSDFEDAAVASAAVAAECDRLITRNVSDFANSPIPVMTPEELLGSLDSETGPPASDDP